MRSDYIQGRIDNGYGLKLKQEMVYSTDYLRGYQDAMDYRATYYRLFARQIRQELDFKGDMLNRVWDNAYAKSLGI